MSKLSVRNEYFTPVKKRTSIGHSSRSKPKNKSKRANFKKYNRQGKWVVALNGERMTETKTTTQASSDYQFRLLQEVNKKISQQRNTAHNKIAELELLIESQQREIQSLKATLEGEKLFKENKKEK
mgnify:FL=1